MVVFFSGGGKHLIAGVQVGSYDDLCSTTHDTINVYIFADKNNDNFRQEKYIVVGHH